MRPSERKEAVFTKLLAGKSDSLFIQLFRYTFVGGVAFLVDFGSLFAFTELLGIHYLISAAIAFILGLITNYLLSIIWVFTRRTLTNRWTELLIFSLIGVVGLGFNELFIWFFTEKVHLHYLLSKIVSTFFVYLWNFFARKYILFN